MKPLAARSVFRTLLAAAGLALPVPGNAITINGLQPLMPLTLHKATASVKNQRLEVSYPDGRLSIHPWPDFLPHHLSGQMIQAERQIWPSGPSERVAFTRPGETQPWLIIGAKGRPTTPVLDDWQLGFESGMWYISNGLQRLPLLEKKRNNRPACVMLAGKRWQVYRLPAPPDSQSPSSASEQEPRISWLVLRQ